LHRVRVRDRIGDRVKSLGAPVVSGRKVLLEGQRQGIALLAQFDRRGVIRILSPGRPHLVDTELLEKGFLLAEAGDVILVGVAGDDECESLAGLRGNVATMAGIIPGPR
jgi:hypothetical protein